MNARVRLVRASVVATWHAMPARQQTARAGVYDRATIWRAADCIRTGME